MRIFHKKRFSSRLKQHAALFLCSCLGRFAKKSSLFLNYSNQFVENLWDVHVNSNEHNQQLEHGNLHLAKIHARGLSPPRMDISTFLQVSCLLPGSPHACGADHRDERLTRESNKDLPFRQVCLVGNEYQRNSVSPDLVEQGLIDDIDLPKHDGSNDAGRMEASLNPYHFERLA